MKIKLRDLPSLSKLNSLFIIDNGFLVRKKNSGKKAKAGDICTSTNKKGYIQVSIDGVTYLAHRIAWKMYYGYDPYLEIDHIDGDRKNNKKENLRAVSSLDQQKNRGMTKRNTSGVMGVFWSVRHKKWYAQICVNYKVIYLGIFDNKEDAIKARKEAEIKYSFHENHGRDTYDV